MSRFALSLRRLASERFYNTFVVTIERIETNRPTGYSASLLAPYAVDPASIAARAERETLSTRISPSSPSFASRFCRAEIYAPLSMRVCPRSFRIVFGSVLTLVMIAKNGLIISSHVIRPR